MTLTRSEMRFGILLAVTACLVTGAASAAVTPTAIQSLSTRVLVARDDGTAEVRLRARLVSEGVALPGKILLFTTEGREVCSATTNSTGDAACSTAETIAAAPYTSYAVSFAGDENYGTASRASEGLLPIDGHVGAYVTFWVEDPDEGTGVAVH